MCASRPRRPFSLARVHAGDPISVVFLYCSSSFPSTRATLTPRAHHPRSEHHRHCVQVQDISTFWRAHVEYSCMCVQRPGVLGRSHHPPLRVDATERERFTSVTPEPSPFRERIQVTVRGSLFCSAYRAEGTLYYLTLALEKTRNFRADAVCDWSMRDTMIVLYSGLLVFGANVIATKVDIPTRRTCESDSRVFIRNGEKKIFTTVTRMRFFSFVRRLLPRKSTILVDKET